MNEPCRRSDKKNGQKEATYGSDETEDQNRRKVK